MFVPVACVKCGKPFQVPEAAAGTNVNCPWCKESVPALPVVGFPASDNAPVEPSVGKAASVEAPLSLDDEPGVGKTPLRRVKSESLASTRPFPFLTAGIVLFLSVFAFGGTLFYRGYQAGRIPDSTWIAFTPPDGSCTVELTGTPTEEQLPALPVNVSSSGKVFIAKGWYSGVRSWVGWYDLDPLWAKGAAEDKDGSQIDPVLNAGQKRRVEVLKGTLQKEGKMLFNAYRGRELQMETERGMVVERLFVVPTGSHPRLYFVGIEGKNLNPAGPAANRLFTAFRLGSE